MVWKKLRLAISFFVILTLVISQKAYAYSIYEGNISSTYTTIFEDVVSGISPLDNYIYYRSGQYEYTLVTGDLLYADNTFSSVGNVKIHKIITNSSGYNNNVYDYSVTTVNDFILDRQDYLVYSDLGDFPLLEERSVVYEYTLLYVAIIFFICCFIRPIFKYTYRSRNGN